MGDSRLKTNEMARTTFSRALREPMPDQNCSYQLPQAKDHNFQPGYHNSRDLLAQIALWHARPR